MTAPTRGEINTERRRQARALKDAKHRANCGSPAYPLPGEIWKPINGYDGYQVSNLGRVWSIRGKLFTPSLLNGYPRVQFKRPAKRSFFVHRLVADAFLGPCPEGLQVNHKDGDRGNATETNLEYVTRSENVRHSYRELRTKTQRGSLRSNTRLTEAVVVQLRAQHAAGDVTCKDLAAELGISANTVAQIVRRQTWRHAEIDLLDLEGAAAAELDAALNGISGCAPLPAHRAYSPSQAGRILGLSDTTVRAYCRRGMFPFSRSRCGRWRVDADAVDQLAATRAGGRVLHLRMPLAATARRAA